MDGAGETACYGGRGDSALGDSVLSTDDMSDPTSRHRGYSADDDDDDDDVIPDGVRDFQVADVTRYFQSLHAQSQRKSGKCVLMRQQCSQSCFRSLALLLEICSPSLSHLKLKFHWDQFPRNFLADLLATSPTSS